jgi:hypothetical protein
MSTAVAKPPPREPVPELGPAMRILPPRWRVAVLALFETKGDRTAAIFAAGYRAKPDSLKVMASRIFADDRVRLAVAEECKRRIDTSEPEVLETVAGIMRDPTEKSADRLRAAAMIWDRSNPVMTKHQVNVTHTLSVEETEIQHFRALQKLGAPQEAFMNRFGPNGLARVQALIAAENAKTKDVEGDAVIDDVEYEELPAGASADGPDEELLSYE